MENSVTSATLSRAELSKADNEILNKIMKDPTPSVSTLDTKSLLSVVTDFLNGAVTGNQAHLDKVHKPHQADLGVPSRIIEKLCCEMKCGCQVSQDKVLQETTLSMFSKLSGYSWESKAVLALFAYAIKYGDLLLLDQIYQENLNPKLVKPMTILKTWVVDNNKSQSGPPKKEIGEITTTILEVTKLTVHIMELSVNYYLKNGPLLSEARDKLSMAVYLTIKTIIACASHFNSLTTTTDVSQLLSTLHVDLNKILDMLKQLSHNCESFIGETERYQRYQRLWEHFVFTSGKVDYVEALKAIIYTKDGMLTKTSTDKTVIQIDELQNMHVLLFISDLDISEEELTILKKTYDNSRADKEHRFEIVWVPVVEQWTVEAKKKFEKLKAVVTWYTAQNFSGTDGAVVKFLKKAWHFHVKPVVIVLNPEGKVESENAMPMINFWGIKAYPFTETKRKELSNEISAFTLDVIFGLGDVHVDSQVTTLIKKNEYILLYGGTEINTGLIERLKDKARAFLKVTKTTMINDVNVHGNLRFWNRLESLLFSRMHNDYYNVDEMFHEIQKLFGYNKVGMWVMLSEGPKVVTSGEANSVFNHLSPNRPESGQKTALDRGCYHYWLRAVAGQVPESLKCLKCQRTMRKYVAFKCCHEDDEGAISYFH